ncbi:type VII secretion target [Amycolatopsis sp. NPDC059027]|uniref:type VII secretion target n=1 Tax=unclassified Amycolatopsis TaxID=2618356 RepID=UPI003672DC93
MPDRLAVDVEHLRRQSREFRASADELRTRIQKFREQTENTHGAYGETPNAAEAEREYRETVRQTLDHLEKMHRDLLETAEGLETQAKVFQDTDTAAADSVSAVFRVDS